MYIAITRAKKQIYITSSGKRYSKGTKDSVLSCLPCLPGIEELADELKPMDALFKATSIIHEHLQCYSCGEEYICIWGLIIMLAIGAVICFLGYKLFKVLTVPICAYGGLIIGALFSTSPWTIGIIAFLAGAIAGKAPKYVLMGLFGMVGAILMAGSITTLFFFSHPVVSLLGALVIAAGGVTVQSMTGKNGGIGFTELPVSERSGGSRAW